MESHDDVARAKGKKVARAYDTKDDYRSPEKEGLHNLSRKSKENGTFEQKRIEIELREKSLESLRAKKGIGN
ncbi:hypothetical protein CASFOL_002913 [Castilleja foliolosa]|uniref:Uncharacterized protein n=1 Tax=Castilleja foliolosa TaxID=1961234 RepID=A0ABD3EG40_9LAMI